MLNTLALFIFLFVTWVVFSGQFDVFFLSVGFFSCVFSIWIMRRLGIAGCESCVLFYTWRSLKYFVWLGKEIVLSSIDVTKRVWQANPKISPTMAWVPTTHTNDVGRTVFANSITLTPGTVSILVYEDKLCVHALCKEGMVALQEGTMDRKSAAVAGGIKAEES